VPRAPGPTRGRRGGDSASRSAPGALDPAAIDALYGLEPVYEPEAPGTGGGPTEFVVVECPYCWEPFETQVDLSAGATSYVEDCQVCCQPIELSIDVADDGRLAGVRPARTD
jgi:hypothetical protein